MLSERASSRGLAGRATVRRRLDASPAGDRKATSRIGLCDYFVTVGSRHDSAVPRIEPPASLGSPPCGCLLGTSHQSHPARRGLRRTPTPLPATRCCGAVRAATARLHRRRSRTSRASIRPSSTTSSTGAATSTGWGCGSATPSGPELARDALGLDRGAPASTPRDLARGAGDALPRRPQPALAEHGQVVYLRPLSEMNNAQQPVLGLRPVRPPARAGLHDHLVQASLAPARADRARRRRRRRSTPSCAASGLPPVRTGAGELPRAAGRADVGAALVRQPGDREEPPAATSGRARAYVDWVGTTWYSLYRTSSAFHAFYSNRLWRSKPFAFAEWGVWGARRARLRAASSSASSSHPRVRMAVYYQSASLKPEFALVQPPGQPGGAAARGQVAAADGRGALTRLRRCAAPAPRPARSRAARRRPRARSRRSCWSGRAPPACRSARAPCSVASAWRWVRPRSMRESTGTPAPAARCSISSSSGSAASHSRTGAGDSSDRWCGHDHQVGGHERGVLRRGPGAAWRRASPATRSSR